MLVLFLLTGAVSIRMYREIPQYLDWFRLGCYLMLTGVFAADLIQKALLWLSNTDLKLKCYVLQENTACFITLHRGRLFIETELQICTERRCRWRGSHIKQSYFLQSFHTMLFRLRRVLMFPKWLLICFRIFICG